MRQDISGLSFALRETICFLSLNLLLAVPHINQLYVSILILNIERFEIDEKIYLF